MSEEMENFINPLSDNVRKNIVPVDAQSLGQDYFLRIQVDKMPAKGYEPRIGRRQGFTEDRSVPRVTCSPTLIGCLIGYAMVKEDFIGFVPSEKSHDYKNGYYLYEIPFQEALRPNKKLVYDQAQTNEHWLVAYNDETRYYQGTLIGKLFIKEITMKGVSGKSAQPEITLIVQVDKKDGIHFSEQHFLKQGFYQIRFPRAINSYFWNKAGSIQVDEITKEQYLSYKTASAAMLSLEDLKIDLPKFSAW